ncbi:hypothetical protein PILCRDRAFT_641714 [Piloderma croceum F 1598]|uniref:Uncharacterized protein n=1 Tax=Piloderma croceum (strain F 1598) TaxID=765440 RepID=A0A0C3EVN7_PILCF|nr:hypothetical protein PILCRDRAFT_641714 [Piloderma croceum F 1598]
MKLSGDVDVARVEAKHYRLLKGCDGFPHVWWAGQSGGCGVLILERLCINLCNLHRQFKLFFTEGSGQHGD